MMDTSSSANETSNEKGAASTTNLFILGILILYFCIKKLKYYGIPENFPPGPPSVPLLGSVPFIRGNFKATLEGWREDYGDIVGLKLGSELTVVLSDYDVINSAFKDDRVTGRPKNLRTIMGAFFSSNSSEEDGERLGSGGIVFSHGAEWREQRRFALRNLRDQGMGKSYMESVILEEVRKLSKVLGFRSKGTNEHQDLDECKSPLKIRNNNSFNISEETMHENQKNIECYDIKETLSVINKSPEESKSVAVEKHGNRKKSSTVNQHLSVAVVNSLWSILTGEKIEHGDERIKKIVQSTNSFIVQESLVGPLMIFPWLRHLPVIANKFNDSKKHPLRMRALQDETVNNRKISKSLDYETGTAIRRRVSINTQQQQQPVRRKTYCGNVTWPTNDVGENNNLKHLDGIELVKDYNQQTINDRMSQASSTLQSEKTNETGEDDAKDYIDVYLRKITKTRERKSSFFGDAGLTNLQRSLTELFGAGSETSATTLLFAILYMIKYPEIQKKVQLEIDGIVGKENETTIGLLDRTLMPYTDATLHEILRHSCLVYAIPHSTTERVRLSSYDIPSGTAIYANIWAVMHDKYYWKDPEVFRPERFLDSDGQFRRDDRCVPFSLGKRYCIGQSLAQNSLFLFFTGILQRFRLKAPDGPESISIDPIVGFIHSCPLYDVEFEVRE